MDVYGRVLLKCAWTNCKDVRLDGLVRRTMAGFCYCDMSFALRKHGECLDLWGLCSKEMVSWLDRQIILKQCVCTGDARHRAVGIATRYRLDSSGIESRWGGEIFLTLSDQLWWPTRLSIKYEGHLESKERFAIKKYLLIIGKKKNMQVLSHTFTYFST